MAPHFDLQSFDPCPLSDKGILEAGGDAAGSNLLALDISARYIFFDANGEIFHEYPLPSDADIHNVGGYVGKVIKYRDPALLEHFKRSGVTVGALKESPFPILTSRSPQLDLVLFQLIERLRAEHGLDRVSLFDLGCTVGEHWDLLNTMLLASEPDGGGSATMLSYCGLDKSSLLLTIAYLLHADVRRDHFRLIHAEGSSFDLPDSTFDLSLSVGVINHVAEPVSALVKLIRATRFATVIALWVTEEETGFWCTIHSGLPFYVFAQNEFREIEQRNPNGRFHLLDYIPEMQSSQERSFIGLGEDRLRRMGCAHLLFSSLHELEWPPFLPYHDR